MPAPTTFATIPAAAQALLRCTMTSLEKALRDFADFAANLKGDEKSEPQIFLLHLLAAFGHDPNTLPEGSTFEYRLRCDDRYE